VLAYRIASPWRWAYAAVVVVVYTTPVCTQHTFTTFGHFSAMLLGFACYPLTFGRGEPWDPGETIAAATARLRARRTVGKHRGR